MSARTINPDGDTPRHGEFGARHLVYYQGQLLVWKVWMMPAKRPTPKKRKEVSGMSHASRFRMLKMIASIDWDLAGECQFMTMTYPDHFYGMHYRQSGMHRSMFWRILEQAFGHHTCGIWRIEWKPRQTGAWIGYLMPHFHVIAFNAKNVDKYTVREWWKRSLGWETYTDVDSKRMVNARQVGYYVSKYCGKIDRTLGIASYHNKIPTGRSWGVLRKDLFPAASFKCETFKDSALTEWCLAKSGKSAANVEAFGNPSFTLMGPYARIIGESIFGNFVDGEIPIY